MFRHILFRNHGLVSLAHRGIMWVLNRPHSVDTFESYITATTEVDMSGKRYTDEFKSEAAKQVIEHGRWVREISGRLRISVDSLYAWVRDQRKSPQAQQADIASPAYLRQWPINQH